MSSKVGYTGHAKLSAYLRPPHQSVCCPRPRIEQVLGLLSAGDRQLGRVEQPYLHQERRIVPVDVLMSHLVALELRHHADWKAHRPTGRSYPWQKVVHLDVVCERNHNLVHELVITHCARDGRDLCVPRPFADEVISVEPADTLTPTPASHHRHLVDVGIVGHRRHCRVEIPLGELSCHVLVEDSRDVCAGLHLVSLQALYWGKYLRICSETAVPTDQ